jgi:hypothetical protein
VCTATRALPAYSIAGDRGAPFKLQIDLGEYNMKMIKIALLGTAALAVVSVSARADNLSDLKAQIEALNARVAAVEAAPAVPAGFSLMTMTTAEALVIPGLDVDKNYGKTSTQFGILPTADVADAAPSTVISWSGYVKAAAVYHAYPAGTRQVNVVGTAAAGTVTVTGIFTQTANNVNTFDIQVKSGFAVSGKTDTAVGEVGAKIAVAGNWTKSWTSGNEGYNGDAQATLTTDGVWGYWKMTPELTLGGGYGGSLSGNGYGYDGSCSCNFTGDAAGGYGLPDATQMRLSYASGPLSFAVALEDGGSSSVSGNGFGAAAEVKYSGDTLSGELSAGWQSKNGFGSPLGLADAAEDRWVVDAGLGFSLGDTGKISAAAGIGSGHGPFDDFTKASIFASINLASSAHAELGVSHNWKQGSNNDVTGIGGGLYYDPASQLTIGLEAQYIANEAAGTDETVVDLVSIFRF